MRFKFRPKPINPVPQPDNKPAIVTANLPPRPPMTPALNLNQIRVIPLGGIGDVTKNMYVYEYGSDILLVDCGIGFPDEAMLGIDLVIPDFTYLRDKKERIRGLIITHGHDDHIGAIPYFLREFAVPIYATRLASALISVHLKEHGITGARITTIDPAQSLRLGSFDLSFHRVNHSIPDTIGIAIKTPVGTIIHQADFKFDWTPVNQPVIEAGKIAALGEKGVLALLTDCLRVEKPGFTLSEKMIEDTFLHAIAEAKGKVFITTTSSNVSRIQQAVNVAQKYCRRVTFSGRSMREIVRITQELGYLKIPAGMAVELEKARNVPDDQLLVIIAGSQGQVGSSLSQLAHHQHKCLTLKENDVVIFSSDPIPSTENAVGSIIDTLTKIGATVYYSDVLNDLHVSGHAAQEEIKLMIGLTKARFLIPIGGTYRHMRQFSLLAQKMNYSSKQVLLLEDGQIVIFDKNTVKIDGKIGVKNVMIDGSGVGDIGNLVLRDRQVMSEDGIVVVIVPVDQYEGKVVGEPDIISRGFVFMKESEELIEQARQIVKKCLAENHGRVSDWNFIRRQIEESLEKFLYQKTKRQPMILPVVVEV